MKKYKWAILGTGSIATKFAEALKESTNAELYAVGSRDMGKASWFRETFNGKYAYGSYEELCQCPEIDIIYIATPHRFHCEHSLLAIQYGKHVLCEKPLALNADESQLMIEAAQAKGVFLMEALWTRFLPGLKTLQQKIHKGAIGDLISIEADFSFQGSPDIKRLYDPQLGGGALLDVGIYPLTLGSLLCGEPVEFTSSAKLNELGVDLSSEYQLTYPKNVKAHFTASTIAQDHCSARIQGSKGEIIIAQPWWHMKEFTIINDSEETIKCDYDCHDFLFQVEEVHHCLKKSLLESPEVSHATSLSMMNLMDSLRKQIGVTYPSDKQSYLNEF